MLAEQRQADPAWPVKIGLLVAPPPPLSGFICHFTTWIRFPQREIIVAGYANWLVQLGVLNRIYSGDFGDGRALGRGKNLEGFKKEGQ